jgi:hypothetical protein
LQRQVDEFLVLVAVADQIGLGVVQIGKRRDQLGLRAGLEPVMVALAEFGDLLDHLALLVDLDRIDSAVAALVAEFLDRRGERLVEFGDARMQQVAETQQHRQVGAAVAQAADHLVKRDFLGPLAAAQPHGDLAAGIDGEIIIAPLGHAV